MNRPSTFRLFLFLKLPLAFFVGLKVAFLTREKAVVSLPFKWLNKNPFGSMYFACLTMASELSTGLLVMNYINESEHLFSMLVTRVEGTFVKRGLGTTLFECQDIDTIEAAFRKAIETGEGVEFGLKSIGKNEDGETICHFEYFWSIKIKNKSN